MARILITAGAAIAGAAVTTVTGNPLLGAVTATGIQGIGSAVLYAIGYGQTSPPRLLDRQVMSSSDGAPILWGYGTQKVSGEVVWSDGLLVLRKGSSDFTSFLDGEGNSIPTNQTFVTNLAIAFGQGPSVITRLWFDSKLVYDSRGTTYRGPWQAGIAYTVDDVVLDWSMSSNPTPSTDSQPLVYFIVVQDIPASANTNYPHATAVYWEQISANYDTSTGQITYRYGFVNDPAYQSAYDIALTDTGLNLLDVDPFDYISPKFYPGDETQMPDAMLESQLGIGNTSAMRGLCYMVLENFVLWDFQNRLPNIRAEVTWSSQFAFPTTQLSVATASYLELDSYNRVVQVLNSAGDEMQRLDLASGSAGTQTSLPGTVENKAFTTDAQGNVWMSHNTGSGFCNLYKLDGSTYAVLLTIALPSGVFPEQMNFCAFPNHPGFIATGSRLSGGTGQFHIECYRTSDGFHIGSASFGNPGSITYGEWFMYPVADGASKLWFLTPHTSDGNFDIWSVEVFNSMATASHTVTPGTEGESLCCAWYGGENTLIMPTANGLIAKWDIASSTYSMLVQGTINPSNLMWDNADFASAYSAIHACGGNRLWTGYFRIPYDNSKHIIAAWSVFSGFPVTALTTLGSTNTFYTGVKLYDLDAWLGSGWAALLYYIDGNQMWSYDGGSNSFVILDGTTVSVLQLDRTQTGPGLATNMVSDICAKAEIPAANIDVTQLAGLSVVGYTIPRPTSGKQILSPLAQGLFFDCVESDKMLKFLPRPQPVVMTIPADDLGLDKDKGAIEESIGQEGDFPQSIEVSYQDPRLNYQVGHQYHWRNTRACGARDRQTVELPFAFTAYQARQAAIKLMKQLWHARFPYAFNLWRASYLQLDPADPVEFTDPSTSNVYTARLVSVSSGQDRSMKCALIQESTSAYTTPPTLLGAGAGLSTSGAGDTGGMGAGSTGGNGGGSGGTGPGTVTSGGGTLTTGTGTRYDMFWEFPGPLAGSYDWRFTADRPTTLPIDLVGSVATAETAATADLSLPIYQIPGGTGTPVNVGSVNFTAGSKVGSYTFNDQVVLASGDVLKIDPTGISDATAFGMNGTIAATA